MANEDISNFSNNNDTEKESNNESIVNSCKRSNFLEVGLPPKSMMFDRTNWLDHDSQSLTLICKPFTINNQKLAEATKNLSLGSTAFRTGKPALAAFAQRINALGGVYNENTEELDYLVIHALHEGAITETFTNEMNDSTFAGNIYNNLGASKLAEFNRMFKNSIGNGDTSKQLMLEGLDWISDYIGLGDETKTSISNIIKQGTEKNLQNLLKEANLSDRSSKTLESVVSQVASVLDGNRPVFPNLWSDSSASFNYTFRIRLYNPNPASSILHQKCIVNPLCILKAMVLPSTMKVSQDESTGEMGQTQEGGGSNTTYDTPLYFSVECKNLFFLPMSMVDNMSIVLGGDDNSISFNGRPNYVDVTLSFKPVYNKRVIADITSTEAFANDGLNIVKGLKGDDLYKVAESNSFDTNDGSVVQSNEQSDEPQPRGNEQSTQIQKELDGQQ